MYQVIISPRATRELRKIPKQYKGEIRDAISDLKENPDLGKALERDLKTRYSYRVGVYRIIYKINHKGNIVNIISCRHRSVVYN